MQAENFCGNTAIKKRVFQYQLLHIQWNDVQVEIQLKALSYVIEKPDREIMRPNL